MLWVSGRVVPDDALKVSVLDRTFEHGLGLFETLRTYRKRASLLSRHLVRLELSAHELGLPISSVDLPNHDSVEALLEAENLEGDVMLRITLTGGLSSSEGATLWMRALPLPPPMRHEGAVVDRGLWWVPVHEPLSRHKSLNYWSRRAAYEVARRTGFDEVLSTNGDAGEEGEETLCWEGSRTNLFAIQGDTLITPSLDGPLVPGIMRGLVLELAAELALEIDQDEQGIPIQRLLEADEVFLTNSVRGIVPVSKLIDPSGHEPHAWDSPRDWTQRLSLMVNDWLNSGGAAT